MTWGEIERRVAKGHLTEVQINELWDCLFLDLRQIDDLLLHVREHATRAFIYPMFVFVAHTGGA